MPERDHRLLCQYTGLSQMRIATAVGLGQGRISEIINGVRNIRDAKVFERIADGLDMPDHARILLGLSPRQIAARTRPRSITPTRPGQDTELLRQITATRSIDGTVVRVLQGETDNIRLLDRRLGAPTVAGKLEAHINHIETGLRYSLRPGNREQLAVVLAHASALAGWQAIDMAACPAPGNTSSVPLPPPARQVTPACWRSPRGSRLTSCWTCTARLKHSPWSGLPMRKPRQPFPTKSAAGSARPKLRWRQRQGRSPPAAPP